MEDSRAVRVGEPLADLRPGLDRGGIVELAGPQRLAEGAARDVLVDDVDVPLVPRKRVRTEACRVAQARRRRGLALRAGGCLALARDDLESDIEAVLLVADEPDRAGTAAAERPERAVPAEDELRGR